MLNVPNEYFLSSPSSPSLIFNHHHHQQHNTHYHHPYSQISASYYPTHAFDDNHTIQNYDHNLIWNENDIGIGGHTG